jgi:hypothetical protein
VIFDRSFWSGKIYPPPEHTPDPTLKGECKTGHAGLDMESVPRRWRRVNPLHSLRFLFCVGRILTLRRDIRFGRTGFVRGFLILSPLYERVLRRDV